MQGRGGGGFRVYALEKHAVGMYPCGCGREFTEPRHLARHRTACPNLQPSNSFKYCCETCQSRFRSVRTRNHHKQHCGLGGQITNIRTQTNHVTHNHQCVTNQYVTINVPVQVRPFSQEDIQAVKDLRNFHSTMMDILKHSASNAVAKVVELKHFHPDVPQNRNLRKRNRRDKFAEYFDGTSWRLSVMDDICTSVVKDAREFTREFIENNSDKVPREVRDFLMLQIFPPEQGPDLIETCNRTGVSIISMLARGDDIRKKITQSLSVVLYNNK